MKKIVTIGGGTGLSTLLNGVKYIEDVEISAIVTVTDNGGSTGVLREHFDIPAVGDIRRVLGALSRNRSDLEEQMEYRFENTGTQFDGHALGNLIISANIANSKDFAEGIRKTSKMLNVQGEVLPISNATTNLITKYTDGTVSFGEIALANPDKDVDKIWVEGGEATQEAIQAIEKADYVILGMGSLYTSLISNLVFPGIREAFETTKAKVIYIANAFTEHGETDNYKLSDHIAAIEKHTKEGLISDIIFPEGTLSRKTLERYEEEKQFLVKNDVEDSAVTVMPLLYVNKEGQVRHNKHLLKKAIEKAIA
ncbi:gluconeogenesis factor YvcK family protein [Mycoplasma todarodis]|uniref:gluconeogenesis factor YvcK family protein n=1 Tax=Mycoplasma todarodis TaxID=1937191 RepID=UPI003B3806C0